MSLHLAGFPWFNQGDSADLLPFVISQRFKFIFCANKVIRRVQGADYFLCLKFNSLLHSQAPAWHQQGMTQFSCLGLMRFIHCLGEKKEILSSENILVFPKNASHQIPGG